MPSGCQPSGRLIRVGACAIAAGTSAPDAVSATNAVTILLLMKLDLPEICGSAAILDARVAAVRRQQLMFRCVTTQPPPGAGAASAVPVQRSTRLVWVAVVVTATVAASALRRTVSARPKRIDRTDENWLRKAAKP